MLLLLLLLQGLISCYAQGPPIIRVNFHLLQNQTELVLRSGSTVIIMCHGNESIAWSSTAIIPLYLSEHQSVAVVSRSQPKHTGTYSCRYTNRSLPHLTTWIHLYISDGDVSSVLVTPLAAISVKEDSDALLRCLVTDPTVKNVTLHYGSVTHEESLPPGMNVTIDPRRGALIRHVQMRFKGHYFCSGWKDGNRFTSKALELRVKSRLCLLPTLSVSQDTFVHLEGERFEVTCRTDHPLHSYTVAWKYPNSEALVTTRSQQYSGHLYINDTLTVTSVTTLHSGKYICAAENECGVATSTVHLKVIAHPYLRMYLQQRNTRTTAANEVKKDTDPYEMKVQPEVNSSSDGEEWILNVNTSSLYTNASMNGSSRVEVFEDSDLTITFVMEAYPLITTHRWTTPNHVTNNKSDVYQQTYTDGYRSEASLVLRRVRSEERGRYSFHFSNAFFSGVHHIDLRIYRSPNTEITLENDTLTCSIFGYPSPTVFWFTCTGVEETCKDVPEHEVYWTDVTSNDQDVVMTQLSLPTADDVIVKCVGNNSMGESRGVFVPRKTATLFTPVLLTAVSLAAILLLLLLVVSYKWKQKPRYEIRWKIIEQNDGNNYTFVDPTQLPYNQKWEFPRDKLRLGPVLGSGAFGKVVEATAYGLGTSTATRVAVKMLKPSAHSEEREALMSELKILSHLGYHDNIVNLLGACTQGGPMLMITEYCSHGDLLNFLRGRARDFVASFLSVDEGEEPTGYKNMAVQLIRLRSDSGISCCSEYQEMQPMMGPSLKQSCRRKDCLSVIDLMRFSLQVAQGLDFLSNQNCIHRDVAARNVLLTDRHVAKICDFGLARDIRDDDSYIVQGNSRLPVKWMAPESIFQCIYTVQSDVWSYGVLLWEIFSLGKSPYPNMAVDTNFYKMIKDGRHMAQPDFAPAEMYQLMTLCWNPEPTERPTFKRIGQLIDQLLPSNNDTSPSQRHQATYKNIDECREEEEQEEVEGQEPLKDCHDEDEPEEQERKERTTSRKNIYQLS